MKATFYRAPILDGIGVDICDLETTLAQHVVAVLFALAMPANAKTLAALEAAKTGEEATRIWAQDFERASAGGRRRATCRHSWQDRSVARRHRLKTETETMWSAILVLIGFLAICAIGFGLLTGFAGAMSDSPSEASDWGASGGTTVLIGGAVLVVVIAVGVWRAL